MPFSADDVICGVRAGDLRDALRWLSGRTFVAEAIGDQIGLDLESSRQLCRDLVAEGYIRRHSGTGLALYVETDKALDLTNATS